MRTNDFNIEIKKRTHKDALPSKKKTYFIGASFLSTRIQLSTTDLSFSEEQEMIASDSSP
jgi:hypothetical protein